MLTRPTIAFDAFEAVDIRVGTIIHAEPNAKARKPAYILHVDFGAELGTKMSSAQITEHYGAEALIGRQVCAVVNFEPKRIAGIKSEVLVLGLHDAAGAVVLIGPDQPVANGEKLC